MCTNTRLVRNRYTHRSIRVSCGKCPACLQDKANKRANRIRNNSTFGYITLFVTLTYSNDFLPYIRRSEINDFSDVPIYRRCSVRCYRNNVIVRPGVKILDTLWFDDVDNLDCSTVPSPTNFGDDDCISVIYYPDLQNFYKRLRINLKRFYNYEKYFSFYACAEYGSGSKRAHFHTLLSIPSEDFEIFRDTINKSWPFCDEARKSEYVEIARNAASYVASYVNCSTDFPKFLKNRSLRQKHSYSKGFGCTSDCFSLRSLLSAIESGDLHYYKPSITNGVPALVNLPIPKYVINRYFPKFKGYSVLADHEIRKLLLDIESLSSKIGDRSLLMSWTPEDKHNFYTRLLYVRKLFKEELGLDYDRFAIYYPYWYTKIWSLKSSTSLIDSYKTISSSLPLEEFYENFGELDSGRIKSDLLDILDWSKVQFNPNKRSDVVQKSQLLFEQYVRYDKSRKVVNHAMVNLGHNV